MVELDIKAINIYISRYNIDLLCGRARSSVVLASLWVELEFKALGHRTCAMFDRARLPRDFQGYFLWLALLRISSEV